MLIPHRGNSHQCPEAGAIFTDTPTFGFDPALRDGHFELALRYARGLIRLRIKFRKMLPNDFVSRITFDALRTGIPGRNPALRIQHEDSVIFYTGHQKPKLLVRLV